MVRHRVLLLEDDPAVRRFVQLALDALPVDLVPCATLAEARDALSAAAAPLVLTDLNLPDGGGLELLEWLRARPPGAACRTVVFSGGVDPAMQRTLEALQVWRVLHKPASVGRLVACVSDALDSLATAVPQGPSAAVADHVDPVTAFFGGHRGLYEAYRAACLAQFPQDLGDGDRAAGAGDAQALRRVAHNLKSVMLMLGSAQAAHQARVTEEAAAQGAQEPMRQGWLRLRAQVQGLLAGEAAP